MTDNQGENPKKWIDEAEEALNRTAEALKSAWNETRDARMSTLEAAKEAAARLGKAIDQGIEVASQSWDREQAEEAPATSAATEETHFDEEE